MELIKVIVTIALTFAIAIALAMKSIGVAEEKPSSVNIDLIGTSTIFPNVAADQPLQLPSKRVSRFLKQEAKNPRAASHCNKDGSVCFTRGGYISTCCSNKCVNFVTDENNCGACGTKCKFTETCCRGECVNISFDKRHCGGCNNRCQPGELCVYGMCNYA